MQAESCGQAAGSAKQATSGGQNIGPAGNGDRALYQGVDFGTRTGRQFQARVAGGVSGLVEVRLDSRSNAPVGSFAVGDTGGRQNWRTVPANISGITGKHDVYLTFASGQPADLVSVNWFTFTP
ncbi:carbohydrate-binding protein [Amycolatopsis coloradensis]|uniref:carbohydrate-binding protein n=1 Tax=Amycolatopsis coloradensis TaxID=76021 RepID=UPI001FC9231B|nr:carbohydrate-binding protein [Amycolatopsis coloradensis]